MVFVAEWLFVKETISSKNTDCFLHIYLNKVKILGSKILSNKKVLSLQMIILLKGINWQ